jgi:hypothetical protein
MLVSLRTIVHPLYTRLPRYFRASVSETTMRPRPRVDLGEHRDLVADERLRQEAIGVDPDLAVAADRPHLQV